MHAGQIGILVNGYYLHGPDCSNLNTWVKFMHMFIFKNAHIHTR